MRKRGDIIMYIVLDRSAHMPNSCKGRYRRVGVVKTDGRMPKMLSYRARGVIEVIETWERLNATTNGPRTAYARALREAKSMAAGLNLCELSDIVWC
jgi:hypothetical protein